jgi:ZIP family zinc transporter
MIYVSLIEIVIKARDSLVEVHGDVLGAWLTAAAFFGGILVIAIIDRILPEIENPHHGADVSDMDDKAKAKKFRKLYNMGIFTAIAIAIHNFPEGLATFAGALTDPALGIAIAVAIAIHNIPEGIAVSVPIYYATGSKKKAFFYSFLSGLAEPVGAAIGFFLLYSFFNEITFGILFASVAGIMVFISLDELLPTSREYGTAHLSIYGLIAGMAVMALSLLLLL